MSSSKTENTMFGGRGVAAELPDANPDGETTPLLGQQQPRTPQEEEQKNPHGASAPDAIEKLERLPVLLVHAVAVFTVAMCLSAVLGAVRTGWAVDMHAEWCILPVVLACLWLMIELVLSMMSVRRIMIEEERKRRLTFRLRKVRRRRQRQQDQERQQQQLREKHQQRQRRQQQQQRKSLASPSLSPAPPTAQKDQQQKQEEGEAESHPFPSPSASSPPLPREGAATSAAQPGRRTRRRRDGLRGEIPLTVVAAAAATMITATASVATPTGGSPRSSDGLLSAGPDSERDEDERGAEEQRGRGGGSREEEAEEDEGQEEKVEHTDPTPAKTLFARPQSRRRVAPRRASAPDRGAATAAAAAATKVAPEGSPVGQPRRRAKSETGHSASKYPDGPARAVRMSALLQLWIRLWLTMVGFAVMVATFTLLLSLRFLGVSSQKLSIGAISSPVLVALALLSVHSFIMLDGNGGSGGGAAIRAGGSRSALALGRRPVIALVLVSATLVIFKANSDELATNGGENVFFSLVGGWTEDVSWLLVLLPLWVMAALVEGVYLVALWEDWMGESLASTLLGSIHGGGGCLRCCFDDASDGCKCPRWGGGGEHDEYRRPSGRRYRFRASGSGGRGEQHRDPSVSYFSGIRRRVELSPSQRAAAASIAGGILCISLAVLAVALRRDDGASWSVPMTMLMSAAGIAMVGAGLGQMAAAYCQEVRGPLPSVTKPLPIFYSERQGGWIVGPADPPMVPIFLLGDVTLRQEGVTLRGGAGAGRNDGWGSNC